MVEKLKTKKELFLEAQNEQLKVVAHTRVAVLKALDELQSFNGKDEYEVGLPIIVNAYPEGILQARVREVMPDALKLAKAVKALDKKEIEVDEISPRNILFKPGPQMPVQPPLGKVEFVDTNPTGDPKWDQKPEQPTNPRTPVQDITEE